jgi:hypothetical protein
MWTLGFFTSGAISKARLIGVYPLTKLTADQADRAGPIGNGRSQLGDFTFTHRFHQALSANFTYPHGCETGHRLPPALGGIDLEKLAQVPSDRQSSAQ